MFVGDNFTMMGEKRGGALFWGGRLAQPGDISWLHKLEEIFSQYI